jgi:hypothetical protein
VRREFYRNNTVMFYLHYRPWCFISFQLKSHIHSRSLQPATNVFLWVLLNEVLDTATSLRYRQRTGAQAFSLSLIKKPANYSLTFLPQRSVGDAIFCVLRYSSKGTRQAPLTQNTTEFSVSRMDFHFRVTEQECFNCCVFPHRDLK